MEGYCSTGQSPRWAVVTVEEEEVLYSSGLLGVKCYTVGNVVFGVWIQHNDGPGLTRCSVNDLCNPRCSLADVQFLCVRERLCWSEGVKIKSYIGSDHSYNFEHVTPSSLAKIHRRFGEIYCVLISGIRAGDEVYGMFS
jgi:hypothetical protein